MAPDWHIDGLRESFRHPGLARPRLAQREDGWEGRVGVNRHRGTEVATRDVEELAHGRATGEVVEGGEPPGVRSGEVAPAGALARVEDPAEERGLPGVHLPAAERLRIPGGVAGPRRAGRNRAERGGDVGQLV